jgi:DNA invertase Pin-like site-specific DNA recombinase
MSDTLIGYARCCTDAQALTAQRQRLAELGVTEDRISLDHGLTVRIACGPDSSSVRGGPGRRHARGVEARSAHPFRARRPIGDDLAACDIRLSLGGKDYDPTNPMGKMFFNILATFAEFFVRIRTREGMAVARAKGKLRGRRPKLSPKQQAELCRMYASGDYSIANLAELFTVSRPTISARFSASTSATPGVLHG